MRQWDSVRRAPALALVAALLNACSTTFAASGASVVTERQSTALTLATSTQVSLPGVPLTLGGEGALKWRFEPFDHGNQWHLTSLFGYAYTPRGWSDPFGVEALGLVGVARAYDGASARTQFMLGARAQLLIRLSSTLPPWQSDQLVAAHWFLVPNFGCTFYTHAATFELTYGLGFRLQFESGALP